MQIGGLQKLTLVDYPNKLACTVFLAGCNYRCPWCYNGELVLPEKIKESPVVSEQDLFSFLKQRRGLLEAVCIGGGEPCCQSKLPQFCDEIKKLGYNIKIDTNGSNPAMLGSLISSKLVDYLAMDVKAPKEKYSQAIGLGDCALNYLLSNIGKSIAILKKSKIDYEFRTTFVPGLLSKKDILKIVHWLRPAKKYCLQNFQPEKTLDLDFEKLMPYPQEELFKIREAIAPFFDECLVR